MKKIRNSFRGGVSTRFSRQRGAMVTLVAASVALIPAVAGAIAAGYPPFPTDTNQPGVWAVTQPEGVNATTIELVSAVDGSTMSTLGTFSGSYNALAYYSGQQVLVALEDSQFIDTIPLNNRPTLHVIDAAGTITPDLMVNPPSIGFGGTVLSYMAAASDTGTYYLVGYQYTVSQSVLIQRMLTNTLRGTEVQLVLGHTELSADPTPAITWGPTLDFTSSTACSTHRREFFMSILAGKVPTSMFQDFAVAADGTLQTVMTGSPTTADQWTSINPTTGVVTCTPMTGDAISGMSGGIAFTPGYAELMALDLSNGNLYRVVDGVSTLVSAGDGSPIRGDMASNPLAAVTPDLTTTTTTTTTTEPTTTTTTTTEPTTTTTTTTEPTTTTTTTTEPTTTTTTTTEPATTTTTTTEPATTTTTEAPATTTTTTMEPTTTTTTTSTTEPTTTTSTSPATSTTSTVPATSTPAPSTTAVPSTTAAPSTTASPTTTSAATSTTAGPAQVAAVTVTAPPTTRWLGIGVRNGTVTTGALAFTGSDASVLLLGGATSLLAGALMIALGIRRRD